MKRISLIVLALAALTGCKDDEIAVPKAVSLTEENVSFFCQMNVLEHGGPKAQVHLEGYPSPLFFAQVRDAIAYLKSPEREARVLVTYVSDMGAAEAWDRPGIDNWIASDAAVFVIEARVAGGMGAPEVVPFSSPTSAQSFTGTFGGQVVQFSEITDEAVFGAVDPDEKLQVPK